MNWKLFLCESCEKINLSRPDFLDSQIVTWGMTSLTDFYKQVDLLLKKDMSRITERSFLFEINSEDTGISKLKSQLKLLSSS